MIILFIIFGTLRTIESSDLFDNACYNLEQQLELKAYYYEGFCYVMHTDEKLHSEAQNSCNRFAFGRLAVITNLEQLKNIAQEFDIQNGTWVGSAKACLNNDTCSQNEKQWLYISGQNKTPMKSNNGLWAADHPISNSDAAILTKDGLTSVNSTEKHQVLCQYPELPTQTKFVQRQKSLRPSAESLSFNTSGLNQHKCGTLCAKEPPTDCLGYAFKSETGECHHHWLPSEALNFETDPAFVFMERIKPKFYSCPTIRVEASSVSYDSLPYSSRVSDKTNAAVSCNQRHKFTNGGTISNHKCVAPHWHPPTSDCIPGAVAHVTCNTTGDTIVGSADNTGTAVCDRHFWFPNEIECTSIEPRILLCGPDSIESYFPGQPNKNELEITLPLVGMWVQAPIYKNKILLLSGFVGGVDQSCSVDPNAVITYLYDPISKTIADGPNMTQNRCFPAATSIHGEVIVCGSYTDDANAKTCEKLVADGKFVPIASMKQQHARFNMAALGSYVYATGLDQNIERYDWIQDRWDLVAPLPYGGQDAELVVLNGILYVCGLHGTKTCYKYNVENDQWSPIADTNQRHNEATTVAWQGKLFALGSFNDARHVVEAYDPTSDTWSFTDGLLAGRYRHSGVLF